MIAISRGGAVSMAARPKRAAMPGECRIELPGLFGVPGVRGLGICVRGKIWELRREGVVNEPERVSEGRGLIRPINSGSPVSLVSGGPPPPFVVSTAASVHRRCRMMDFVAH